MNKIITWALLGSTLIVTGRLVVFLLLGCLITGCGILPSGEMGVYHRRIDHAELTQAMTEKPWWCGLFTCDAKGEIK